jgi:hypothetical protein
VESRREHTYAARWKRAIGVPGVHGRLEVIRGVEGDGSAVGAGRRGSYLVRWLW